MSEDWIRPGEAARMLGVSLTTITRYVDAGDLVAQRLPSGQRRISRKSVEELKRKGRDD